MRTKFAKMLMRIKAATGISFYRMGQFGGITGPTMSKWFLPVDHKYHRDPTEAQTLEISVSLAYDGDPPRWLRDLYEAEDATFLRGLDKRRSDAGLGWTELAARSTVGTDRVGEIVAGGVAIPRAVRLRLLIATIFTSRQVALTNQLLQAANKYVMPMPEPALTRSA